METINTENRKWSRAEVAELLVSRNALTEMKMEHALQVVRLLSPQRVSAGTVLIAEGVTSTGFMALVLSGEAVVVNESRASHEDSVMLSQLRCGSVFGELGVLDGKPRSATVTALTDMDIAVLDRPALARLIETVPSVACALLGAIMERVAQRLRATNTKVKSLAAANHALREELDALKGK
ncbi:MAG: cyclic nucleotide-binding domain-containing protein [Burkholderiales bacterium]|nr:cyclic nucleotide-binding domain-containing protein [Burkholderiales bacterium]